MAVVARNPADGHLIQRYRDGSHAVLSQDLREEPHKFLQPHRLPAQNLYKLVQHTAQYLPELGRLFRVLQPPACGLSTHLGIQSRLEPQLLQTAHIASGLVLDLLDGLAEVKPAQRGDDQQAGGRCDRQRAEGRRHKGIFFHNLHAPGNFCAAAPRPGPMRTVFPLGTRLSFIFRQCRTIPGVESRGNFWQFKQKNAANTLRICEAFCDNCRKICKRGGT